VRRLIINADDFGLTLGVNRAILGAHRDGVVTSATLMANGPVFAQAVADTATAPKLGVGCHVVLVDGVPLSDQSRVRSLVDPEIQAFRRGFGAFALAALRGKLVADEIEEEVTRQIRHLQSAGIAVTHVDSHKHVHMLPQVLRPILKAAAACGVKAIRNPFEPIRLRQFASRPTLWKRGSQVAVLGRLGAKFRQAVREAGLITPDGTIGIVATGFLGERLLRYMIENLAPGTWELVSHPGYPDSELRRTGTRLVDSRRREFDLLTAPGTRELLSRNGIELISYRDL